MTGVWFSEIVLTMEQSDVRYVTPNPTVLKSINLKVIGRMYNDVPVK